MIPRVSVAPDRVSLRPGENTSVDVTIENTIQAIGHCGPTVLGLPRTTLFAFYPHVATLTVRARAPWSGQEMRRSLTLRATAPPDLAAERTVTFVQKPRIPGGPLRVVGIAAAVGVLAAATLAGALMSKAKQQADPNRRDAAATAAQPPVVPPVVPGVSTAPAGKT